MTASSRPLAAWLERVRRSQSSPLLSKVEALVADGVEVHDLGVGDADNIVLAPHVRDEAIAAIREEFNGYTSTAGMMPLRRAIAERVRESTGLVYDPRHVVVSVGAKHAIFNAICTLAGPGDEVLLPVPHWVSFPDQVRFAGATPVFVPTEGARGWKVRREDLERAATGRTRLLILNTPNNPTGAVYARAELEEIARFCVERDLWVLSDEIYAPFAFTAEGHTSIAALPGMRERTVVVSGASKAYGMTGWRIGYAAAPPEVASAMVTLQSHTTSNPTGVAQRAALAAFRGPQDQVAATAREYDR
ncbi:MAG: aminotransferase class I/II-fold pyridoxal phosphate-dependent enzyme, partial [Chloroflexi bacterium]|nr:aminotransferase class I/II-fold pyridoxal phosphate-dependent enzyme [Chloroflexota bacterium]